MQILGPSSMPMTFKQEVIISPWRRAGPSFEQTWIPFIQECFVPSLVETDLVALEETMRMWKVYDNNNDANGANDEGQRTNFDQNSSLESSAQVS